ncbi:MAG: HD domain-containing protein [Rhizobacter sp.]|nr:HD domain-containing protein [Chlorobiales bacterium]
MPNLNLPPSLFESTGGFIRVPVWGHIALAAPLKSVLSHPNFLRLKGIRQLSFAHQVFPGATHTRFEHSLGVYHLMKLILQRLTTSELAMSLQTDAFRFDENACKLLMASCLLHDVGHYPHAHVVEDLEIASTGKPVFDHHQDLTESFVFENIKGFGSLAGILEEEWDLDVRQVVQMVEGRKPLAFSKVISGTLDPDKMDYLMRDAHHCNIPYGNIDIERLIESFVPDAKHRRFAITSKGIAPLESLMFAKYMMMRNVYWHHTTRTCSAMLRRLLQDAADEYCLSPEELRKIFYHSADDRVLYDLQGFLPKTGFAAISLSHDLLNRVPYKRALTISFDEKGTKRDTKEKKFFTEISSNPKSFYQRLFELGAKAKLRKAKEIELCRFVSRKFNLSLAGHEIVIDAPSRKTIFDYEDFCGLQICDTRGKRPVFKSFDTYGESLFRSNFILEAEKYAKKFRLTARADVAEKLRTRIEDVIDILQG